MKRLKENIMCSMIELVRDDSALDVDCDLWAVMVDLIWNNVESEIALNYSSWNRVRGWIEWIGMVQ